jgi:hypothetical protein
MTDNKDGLQEVADLAGVARDRMLQELGRWMDANPEGTFLDWLKENGYVLIPS